MNRRISKLIRRYSKFAELHGIEYDGRTHKSKPNLYKVNKRKYKSFNSLQRLEAIKFMKERIIKMQS